MTIQELITALSAFPPQMEAMVEGAEGGAASIQNLEKVRILRNALEDFMTVGPHEIVIFKDSISDDEAVLITRDP